MQKILLSLVFIIWVSNVGFGQVNSVMSYNIKNDYSKDEVTKWDYRKSEMVDLLKYYAPDILGTQEGLLHQLTYLSDHLPHYSSIGVGRDDGKEKGEFCTIFYNHEKLTLEHDDTFWLSETGDIGSLSWDAAYTRICTYGLFTSIVDNEKFLVFNTHYDHIGVRARAKSSELILNKIKELNKDNYPVIIMGDFNAEPNEVPILTIAEEYTIGSELVPDGVYGPVGSFTGFVKDVVVEKRIDFVFIKGFDILNYRHIDDKMKDNNYVSDHLPVYVELLIK